MVLGFVQTTTENSKSIGELFVQLKERGMQYHEGLLFVIDGSKGLKKANRRTVWRKSNHSALHLA